MSDETQVCPKCSSPYAYQDQLLWICPECAHEWSLNAEAEAEEAATEQFLDANGVKLESGDTVRVIKDLKVGNGTIKSGTKVKSIRLLDEPVNGHDISCRIDGFGSVYLKCSVVRKD
ncbi:MAG TPA: zinc ribbon domain-containing protein YjdM [Bacteriovoracaceae bacterium]|nr:zinc ribbon domain-containing protein YjdM [Bacteriovoracaceae bacterium]